ADKFLMPKLSPTMEEGQIARWLKAEGETFEEGETIAEVDTDKATMELTALKAGTLLKILKQGGETALLNETIAITGKAGEDFSALLAEVGSKAVATSTNGSAKVETPKVEEPKVVETIQPKAEDQKPKTENGRLLVSPIAARMATENGIDLRTINGSGPQGRIIKRDIEQIVESRESRVESKPSFTTSQVFGASNYRDESSSKMRQIIAERLTASTQNVPHFYLTVEIEMDSVLALRKQINATVSEEQKISVNDIIVKATAMSLVKHSWVNASFQDKSVRFYEDADISIAVAIEDGLITPVVRAANKKGLLAISGEIKELAARAKAKKLQPEEYTGGTFSISNLGMFGIEQFTAIINPPEAGILAIGGANEKAVVRNGEIVIRSMMNVTMSCDHRVIDGATGAKFLQTFKQMLETPAMMLL
ncbi:MAG: pyruvate dehydrogenase complex dihydrolipoamide acetyltransferase, partial [Pyrinomonadaceae bacterium]|nr:pyruvate dehydrogenase complex dihydrolipoamide acetyltransferase [Pyrinomonadaceae bacterium]